MSTFLSLLKEKLESFNLEPLDVFQQRLGTINDDADAFNLYVNLNNLIPGNVKLTGAFTDSYVDYYDAEDTFVYVDYFGHYDGHDTINIDFIGPEGKHKTYLSTEQALSAVRAIEHAISTNTPLSTLNFTDTIWNESQVVFKNLDTDEPELYLAGIDSCEFKNAEEVATVLACLVVNAYAGQAGIRSDVLLDEALASAPSEN